MTQLSPNTVIHDQVIRRISRFIEKYRNNQFATNQQIIQEYQSLVNFLNKKVARTDDGARPLHKRRATSLS